MDRDMYFLSFWDHAWTTTQTVTSVLAQIDPQYLLIAVAILIWFQLGRIARAIKGSGSLPKDLPHRFENLQAKVQSMSNEIADFQVYAVARRHQRDAEELRPHLHDKVL